MSFRHQLLTPTGQLDGSSRLDARWAESQAAFVWTPETEDVVAGALATEFIGTASYEAGPNGLSLRTPAVGYDGAGALIAGARSISSNIGFSVIVWLDYWRGTEYGDTNVVGGVLGIGTDGRIFTELDQSSVAAVPTGRAFSAGYRFKGGVGATMFIDGASESLVADPGYGLTTQITRLGGRDGYATPDVAISAVAAFNTQLSDLDFADLAEGRQLLFARPARRYWMPSAGAASGIPTLSAATVAAITANAATPRVTLTF